MYNAVQLIINALQGTFCVALSAVLNHTPSRSELLNSDIVSQSVCGVVNSSNSTLSSCPGCPLSCSKEPPLWWSPYFGSWMGEDKTSSLLFVGCSLVVLLSEGFNSVRGVQPRMQLSLHERVTKVLEMMVSSFSVSLFTFAAEGSMLVDRVAWGLCCLIMTHFLAGFEQSGDKIDSRWFVCE